MTNKMIILSICLFSTMAVSCMNNGPKPSIISSACHPGEKIIRVVTGELGILNREEATGKISISVHTPGTIDEVSNYLICNSLENMPVSGSKVSFSGKVRKSDVTPNLGGVTNFELEITDIKAVKK